jgi:hypothetical protein
MSSNAGCGGVAGRDEDVSRFPAEGNVGTETSTSNLRITGTVSTVQSPGTVLAGLIPACRGGA